MTRKTFKLDDIQLLLLSVAATRPDGSLIPPSDTLGELSDRIRTAISGLLRRRLAMELDVTDFTHSWRSDGDRLVGIVITDAGRAAIATDANIKNAVSPTTAVTAPESEAHRPMTKQAMLIDMLRGPDGTTLADMSTATGWLAHTTRAALTGLRKKGHRVLTEKGKGVTRYRITEAA